MKQTTNVKAGLDRDLVLYDFEEGFRNHADQALEQLNLMLLDAFACAARIKVQLGLLKKSSRTDLITCQSAVDAISTLGVFAAFQQKLVSTEEFNKVSKSPSALAACFRGLLPDEVPLDECMQVVVDELNEWKTAETGPLLQSDTKPLTTSVETASRPHFSIPLTPLWKEGKCQELCDRLKPVLPILLQADETTVDPKAVLQQLESACEKCDEGDGSLMDHIGSAIQAVDRTAILNWETALVKAAILLDETETDDPATIAVRAAAWQAEVTTPADLRLLSSEGWDGSLNDWATARRRLADRVTSLHAELTLWLT